MNVSGWLAGRPVDQMVGGLSNNMTSKPVRPLYQSGKTLFIRIQLQNGKNHRGIKSAVNSGTLIIAARQHFAATNNAQFGLFQQNINKLFCSSNDCRTSFNIEIIKCKSKVPVFFTAYDSQTANFSLIPSKCNTHWFAVSRF